MDPYLLLAAAEGCEPGLVPALLDPREDPAELLRRAAEAPPQDANDDATDDDSSLRVPPRVRRRICSPELRCEAERWLALAAQHGLAVLTPNDDRYPESLRLVALRPNALFVRGDLEALQAEPAVAVVGSRTPTPYGLDAAQQFADALARSGCTVWSDVARARLLHQIRWQRRGLVRRVWRLGAMHEMPDHKHQHHHSREPCKDVPKSCQIAHVCHCLL